MSDNFYVYAWLRPSGEPFYIGKGSGGRANNPANRNSLFKNIVDKIKREGGSPSVVKLHENLSEAEAFNLEREEIAKHGRRSNGTGILANLTDGGEGVSGHKQSAETIARRVVKITGQRRSQETRTKMGAWQLGRVMSDAARANMSAANRGRQLSESHKEKLRVASTGRVCKPESRAKIGAAHAGKVVSLEARAAMSAARKGVKPTAEIISKREASRRLNPPQPNNKSGFKGVSFSKAMKKWSAEMQVDGKRCRLGYFDSAENAAVAYDNAAYGLWGLNCYLNCPDNYRLIAA